MQKEEFWKQLNQRIAKYDLLCHPFYQAWSAGQLTREDLREYASDYFHHVAAFPGYLAALAARIVDGGLRGAILQNRADEEGVDAPDPRPHSEFWLDFARGMGASPAEVRSRQPVKEVCELVDTYRHLAGEGSIAAALGALYAYESQVPRVAAEKERGLMQQYGADAKTCGYFTLHKTADVHHSQVWRELIDQVVGLEPGSEWDAIAGAEKGAQALWKALDGIEAARHARVH